MRGTLGHPPTTTARTEAAALAGEGHEALERAAPAANPGDAVGQHATGQELAELPHDELGQAGAVCAIEDFPEEGLQVFADDSVKNGVFAVPGLIQVVRMGHALT